MPLKQKLKKLKSIKKIKDVGVVKRAKVGWVRFRAFATKMARTNEFKKILLFRFPEEALREIARARGIPLRVFDPKRNAYREIATKEDLIDLLSRYLTFSDTVRYARIYKIPYDDILWEYSEVMESIEKWKEEKIRRIRG